MKKFWKEFFIRGLALSCAGPLIVAIIYACLSTSGNLTSLTPNEVSVAIISSAVMVFVAAGITAVYAVERLPLVWAILLHASILYADYLGAYLLNGWLAQSGKAIAIFTVSYVTGYALIWLCIYLITRRKTKKINEQLESL